MNMKKKIGIIFLIFILLTLALGSVYLFGFYLPEREERLERERLVAEYREAKYQKYEEENLLYEDYEVDVAFLGDSLTDGYDLEKYYPEYLTANRGIGGETTYGLKDRLKLSVYDLKPKVAVMLIGGNNLDTMFEDYEDILIGFRDNIPDTKIVLVSLTAMGGDWKKKNEIASYNNVKIKLLAEKYGYEFVDLYTPLFDLETGEIKAEYTTDGAHQTSLGYEVFTENIKPVIERLLNG